MICMNLKTCLDSFQKKNEQNVGIEKTRKTRFKEKALREDDGKTCLGSHARCL